MVALSYLLLLSSLFYVTTSTVYTVIPNDHYYPNTTCHHCHNLQHYLLNTTKYLISNTQLLFLPGMHYLYADFSVQNVHNVSLIGSTATDSSIPVNIIYCNSTDQGIVVHNSSMIIMKNILITRCELMYINRQVAFVIFLNCYHVQLYDVVMDMDFTGSNMIGNSILSHLTSNSMYISYDDTVSVEVVSHTLEICSYVMNKQADINVITFELTQFFYGMAINVIDLVMSSSHKQNGWSVYITNCTTYKNVIIFNNTKFLGNNHIQSVLNIEFNVQDINYCFETVKYNHIIFDNCVFANNFDIGTIINVKWVAGLYMKCNLTIMNCVFKNNTAVIMGNLLHFHNHFNNGTMYILSTKFISNAPVRNMVSMEADDYTNRLISSNVILFLEGPIIFYNNSCNFLLFLSKDKYIIFHGYVEFSDNKANAIIWKIGNQSIILIQNVMLNISRNNILEFSTGIKLRTSRSPDIPRCYFQFYGTHSQVNIAKEFKILITMTNALVFNEDVRNINCKMLSGSLFYDYDPLIVYQQFINFQTVSGQQSFFDTGLLCYCSTTGLQKCDINTLGPIFPGQMLIISLRINVRAEGTFNNVSISLQMYDNTFQLSHCKVPLSNENNLQWIGKNCATFRYTVLSHNEEQCKLFFNAKGYKYLTIFYVKLLACPMGFLFDSNTGKCECDPLIDSKLITIKECNIDDQTILRPENGWMAADTYNSSHIYHISLHCPFRYCLPQSSYLNFSTPNSQCQFNRSGILCGQCKQNLSTVFGSSRCHPCSNIYLLLIIPITIAGLLLVLTLFFINLTVTDGTINAFIMYTNIISVNDHVFFTDSKHVFTPVHTFISLANLDLGIQTCFYNGMDDYAKMWLQLAFSFYLISIATFLIIASRYSTTVQRLTARRALPVLATLFLLSYTKILRTVSSVLFSYSKITHLPSEHTTIVWSVDANVSLFNIKFIILFIVCLIFFLVLIPFNIVLLFTKTLSRFQFVNKFKPFLDAYQGPYKLRFYYWAGFQLLIRAVFFGVSALDKNINLTVGCVILSTVIALHGNICPFKNKFKNYQETLYIINLQILFIVTLSEYQRAITVNIMISLAAVQFIIVIIYHIITYSFSGAVRIKIDHFSNTITSWISESNRPSNDNFQVPHIEIPEVTYNYHEYREPLIGQD